MNEILSKTRLGKKALSLLLALIMCLSLIPTVAYAGEREEAPTAVATQEDFETACAAAQNGDTVEITAAGTYKVPAITRNITIKGAVDGVVFNCVGSGNIATVPNGCTFENVTFSMGTNDYHGFQHAGTINMNGCTIEGKFFSYGDMNFTGCTFNQTASDYSMWAYAGNVTYKNCTINCNGKFVNVYNEGNGTWKVTAEGCTFSSTKSNKAAFNVKESCCNGEELHFDVVIKDCTTTGLWPAVSGDDVSTLKVLNALVQIDDRNESTINNSKDGLGVKITVDDKVIYGPMATPVAKIGTTYYETLDAAFAAAQSGDTVTLTADLANVGNVSLPAGITLDGAGHKISGNSNVTINAAGGTVKNVVFENIHNDKSELSAVYASALTGKAVITGCSFAECDWDSIQITPVAGAVIEITGNTFAETDSAVKAQRFVHIQSAKNVDFSATVTNNVMNGSTTQGALECYYFTNASKVTLNKNYIEDSSNNCVLMNNGTNVTEMTYPMYTDADKTDVVSPVATIKGQYTSTFYATLAAALADVPTNNTGNVTIELLSDVVLDASLAVNKNNVVIDGKNFTISASETNADFAKYKVGGGSHYYGQMNLIAVSGNNVTLKNMTIDIKDYRGMSCCTTVGGSNVTYDHITYNGRGSGHYYGYANNGLITFTNCTVNTKGYGIHLANEGTTGDRVVIENCKVYGWNSFGTCESVTVTNTYFGKAWDGDGEAARNGNLALFRPYCNTTLTDCTFSEEYTLGGTEGYNYVGLGTGAAVTVILNNCTVEGGADITSIVNYDDAFDNATAANGSIFAFDATKDNSGKYTAGTFVCKTAATLQDAIASTKALVPVSGKANTYTLGNAVAVVNDGIRYTTVAAAIAAAQDNDTVKLLADCNVPIVVDSKAITLDLNGKNVILDSTESQVAITAKGSAALIISGTGSKIESIGGGDDKVVKAADSAAITINGGSYYVGADSDGLGNSTIYNTGTGLITITAGTFESAVAYNNFYYVLNMKNGTTGGFSVTGGTFVKYNPAVGDDATPGTDFVATGYASKKLWLANKYEVIAATDVVAKIDKASFVSLADAIAAANSGDTIKLVKDVTGSVTIPAGKDIILDLNGKTLSAAGTTILNNGTLTLKGGTVTSTGYAAIAVGNNSNTTIESGVTVNSVEGAVITGTATGATVTINGGTFSASDNAVIAGNGSDRVGDANTITINGGIFNGSITSTGYIACGIYAPWKDIITVNGGTFTVIDGIGIVARAGQVTVNGGTFNCTGTAQGKVGDKAFDMTAAQALYFDATDPAYPAYNSETDFIKVTGGTFNSNVKDYVASGYLAKQDGANFVVGKYSNITSGVYANDPTAYLAADSAAKLGTDGLYTIAAAVAKIGTVKYQTLADAVTAATDGQTIKLLADVDLTEYAANAFHCFMLENKTLDLNGHTITSNNGGVVYDGNNAIIKNGSFVAANGGSYALFVGDGSYQTVIATGIVLENLTCTGGINVYDAEATLKSCDVTGTTYYAVWADEAANVTIEGGNYTSPSTESGYVINTGNTGSVSIKGGSFNAPGNVALFFKNVSAEGGIFNKQPDASYVANGYAIYNNDDATYKFIVKADNAVAKIGDVSYDTLAAAFAAVKSGETINVLKNCSGDGIIVPENSNFTVDFGGHTYTVNTDKLAGSTGTQTQAFQLLQNSTLTFKNGTIVGDNANVKMLIQNYANLTLDGMTLDATQGTNNVGYVLSNNCGNVVINNSTITAKSTGVAFDTCKYSTYAAPTVTVNGTSAINGKIEVSGGNLTLTSGNFAKASIAMVAGSDSSVVTKDASVSVAIPDAYAWSSSNVLGKAVAEIGEIKYTSLADAIAAVEDNETITMLQDVTNAAGMAVDTGKTFTINFAGHTYTVNKPGAGSENTETNAFQLLKDQAITMKNGTINCSEENLTAAASGKNIKRIFQNYAALTLENMTIDGTNVYGDGNYVMSFNNQPVSIVGNTSVILKSGATVAFDADGNWGGYDRCKVTINTTGTIGGNIELGQGYLDIQNVKATGIVLCKECGDSETTNQAARISITGGTFSSDPSAYVANGYTAKAIDGGYEVVVAPTKVETAETATTVDTGDTVGTNVPSTIATAVKESVVNQITNNAVKTSTSDIQTKISSGTITVKDNNTTKDITLNQNTDTRIDIKLNSVQIDVSATTTAAAIADCTVTTKTATYDVKPVVTVTSTNETTGEVTTKTYVITNEWLQENDKTLTFTLPVPDSMTGASVLVTHTKENGNVETFTEIVKTDVNGESYVEIEANEFSTYALSQQTAENSVAKIENDSNIYYYDSVQKAIDDAQDGNTVVMLQNVNASLTVAADKVITLDLNGKTLTSVDTAITNNGSLTITGNGTVTAPIVLDDETTSGTSNGTIINGGTFNGIIITGDNNVEIIAGIFDTEVENEWIADTSKVTESNDTWTVTVDDNIVAKVGNTKYTKLQTAIAAAKNGGTVVLLQDVNTAIAVNTDYNVTLDLNGKTLTFSSTVITNKGTLTITGNGTVNGKVSTTSGITNIESGNFTGTIAKSGTGKYAISGGIFTNVIADADCAPGYGVYKTTDNKYSVAITSYEIETASKAGTQTSVAPVSGAGEYVAGEQVTLVASNTVGYIFDHWEFNGEIITGAGATYTFTAGQSGVYTAVYNVDNNACFKLTVNAAKTTISVDGAAATNEYGNVYNREIDINKSVTVTYQLAEGESFLYWATENGAIMGREKTITFTMTSNKTLVAYTTSNSTEGSTVVYVNGGGQIISSRYYAKPAEGTTAVINQPRTNPTRPGYTFNGWNLDDAAISAKLGTTDNAFIVVTPIWDKIEGNILVTINYQGVDHDATVISVASSTMTAVAPEVEDATGAKFAHWMLNGQVAGYNRSFNVYSQVDMELTAVYTQTGATEVKPTVVHQGLTKSISAEGKYQLINTILTSIPDGYSIEDRGVVLSIKATSKDALQIGMADVYKIPYAEKNGDVFQYIGNTSNDTLEYYFRGYLTVKDSNGNVTTLYSDIVSGSYSTII